MVVCATGESIGLQSINNIKRGNVKHLALSCRNDCRRAFLLLASTTNKACYYDSWCEFGNEFLPILLEMC